MPWRELTFDVPGDLRDAVVGELSACGAAGVWEASERLIAYFDSRAETSENIRAAIQQIFQRSGFPPPEVSESAVDDHDWNEEWKKSYTTFALGERFFVIPSWCDTVCPEDRLPIRIDPGQAFGTGTHETTQMTLEALERWIERDQIILDLGTGSGILAIACRMLGARHVFACDNDPVAVLVARENVGRNLSGDVAMTCGSIDAFRSDSLDILLCNMTADLIIRLFPEFDRTLRDGSLAIFSGILGSQRAEILDTVNSHHFTVLEESTRGEWFTLVGRKHGS